jgi:hypothetical protein
VTDDNIWPLPLRRHDLDDDPKAELDEEPGEAHSHDETELRAVERVVAELVRGASRGTRHRILALLDNTDQEAQA